MLKELNEVREALEFYTDVGNTRVTQTGIAEGVQESIFSGKYKTKLVLNPQEYGTKAREALTKLDAVIKQLDSTSDILNPRTWTIEMSRAWHTNIPDTQKAFDALRKIIKGKDKQLPESIEKQFDTRITGYGET